MDIKCRSLRLLGRQSETKPRHLALWWENLILAQIQNDCHVSILDLCGGLCSGVRCATHPCRSVHVFCHLYPDGNFFNFKPIFREMCSIFFRKTECAIGFRTLENTGYFISYCDFVFYQRTAETNWLFPQNASFLVNLNLLFNANQFSQENFQFAETVSLFLLYVGKERNHSNFGPTPRRSCFLDHFWQFLRFKNFIQFLKFFFYI
jgi:hypothetical protein